MKKYFFISLLIALVIFSCKKKDNNNNASSRSADIVSYEEMKSILTDILFTEAALVNEQPRYNDKINYYTKRYYSYVFKKHKITKEQFQKSYTYYASDIDGMNKMMTEIIDELSQNQSKVKKE